jgi:hypothetical protein
VKYHLTDYGVIAACAEYMLLVSMTAPTLVVTPMAGRLAEELVKLASEK